MPSYTLSSKHSHCIQNPLCTNVVSILSWSTDYQTQVFLEFSLSPGEYWNIRPVGSFKILVYS